MMKKHFFILFFVSVVSFSQNENLRIEIIDVVKEHIPKIASSIKISRQPIFNDTLKSEVVSTSPILNQNLFLKENIFTISPNKLRFNKMNKHFKRFFSVDVGNQTFFNTKFNYTNGVSTHHNSGIYFENNSEDFWITSPYYRKHNGEIFNSVEVYTNRFLNNKLLRSAITFNNKSGLYWGDLEEVSIADIENYNGKNISFNLNLNQMSNEHILNYMEFSCNYFFNNYQRNELTITSSVSFLREKALKTHTLSFDVQLINTNFDNLISPIQFDFDVASIDQEGIKSSFSDVLFGSDFTLAGNKIVDYNIGFNVQYFNKNQINASTQKQNNNFLFFPAINIFKKISNNQNLQFSVKSELMYYSFSDLFYLIPYIDPYYRNSVSKEMKVSFSYNRRLGDKISFFSSVNYTRDNDKLTSFLLFNRDSSMFSGIGSNMNPIGLYTDDFRGVDLSSSFSLDGTKYNVLMEGTWNFIKSKNYSDIQLIPKFKFNTIITLEMTDYINLISNWYFISDREAIRMDSDPIVFELLNSSINTNLSINYSFKSMIFSIDFRNILAQKLYFFDGYYDDDGRKLSLGFFYKF